MGKKHLESRQTFTLDVSQDCVPILILNEFIQSLNLLKLKDFSGKSAQSHPQWDRDPLCPA